MDVPYCPLAPTPAQLAFISYNGHQAVLRGGRKTGKTTALIMAALSVVEEGDNAIVFLRNETAVSGWVDRLHDWLSGSGAEFYPASSRWWFPNSALLTLEMKRREEDAYFFSGSEYGYVGLDYGESLSEVFYRALQARLCQGPGFVRATWDDDLHWLLGNPTFNAYEEVG